VLQLPRRGVGVAVPSWVPSPNYDVIPPVTGTWTAIFPRMWSSSHWKCAVTDRPKRAGDSVNNVFGDPLRELPVHERDSVSPEDAAEHDEWLRENIPPHHGWPV